MSLPRHNTGPGLGAPDLGDASHGAGPGFDTPGLPGSGAGPAALAPTARIRTSAPPVVIPIPPVVNAHRMTTRGKTGFRLSVDG